MLRCCLTTMILAMVMALNSHLGNAQELEIIVPAFANPGSDTANEQGLDMWTDLIQSSGDVGIKLNVILNPGSGPGGDRIDLNYIHENPTPPLYPAFESAPLVEVKNGGADIFAYVPTGFGPVGNADADKPGRSFRDVCDDIDAYFDSNYYDWAEVQVNGIFLDEMSQNVDNLEHYQNIYRYIKDNYGEVPVIANPGLSVAEAFLSDTNGPVADTIVIFEGNDATYNTWAPQPWVTSGNYDRSQFAHIVHGVTDESTMLSHVAKAFSQNAGMIFVGNDTGTDANDYGQWPSFWQQEVSAVTTVGEPITTETLLSSGDQQRSMLTQIEVSFDKPVNIGSGAFAMKQRGDDGGSVDATPTIDNSGSGTKVTLSFAGQFVESSGSLVDGNYQIEIQENLITNNLGIAMDLDGNGILGDVFIFGNAEVHAFYRLFGDSDQNRTVDVFDLLGFRQAYLMMTGDASFDESFDANADGIIDVRDLLRFRQNYLKVLLFDDSAGSRLKRSSRISGVVPGTKLKK